MPILINDVVTKFETPPHQSGTAQASPPAPPTIDSAEINRILEMQALQQARQQRLEVD